MRRVKTGRRRRGFINQASQINCYEVSPINSPFGFNNLGGRLNNLCRDLSFIEESAMEGAAVTQIASRRTVPLSVTVMKYNYQRDLLKNSSTAPLPSKEGRWNKNPSCKQSVNWWDQSNHRFSFSVIRHVKRKAPGASCFRRKITR